MPQNGENKKKWKSPKDFENLLQNITHTKDRAKVEATQLGLGREIPERKGSGDAKSRNSPFFSEGTNKTDAGD